ncbi:MAG: hypothetical protein QOJ29_5504, partial [Thermoleophilaceae bacterium]|nr:hypothetical protein [Thermoleophilaceae bacterium]
CMAYATSILEAYRLPQDEQTLAARAMRPAGPGSVTSPRWARPAPIGEAEVVYWAGVPDARPDTEPKYTLIPEGDSVV